jgi:hypothetical protein
MIASDLNQEVLGAELRLNTRLPYLKISQILECGIKAYLINLHEYVFLLKKFCTTSILAGRNIWVTNGKDRSLIINKR